MSFRRSNELEADLSLIRRVDATGSTERKAGGWRPKSARMPANVAKVEELICSQEDKYSTHKSPREIERITGNHLSSCNISQYTYIQRQEHRHAHICTHHRHHHHHHHYHHHHHQQQQQKATTLYKTSKVRLVMTTLTPVTCCDNE